MTTVIEIAAASEDRLDNSTVDPKTVTTATIIITVKSEEEAVEAPSLL